MERLTGTCPQCNGTGKHYVDETGKPVGQVTPYPRWPQHVERGWMPCHNCGGQTMSLEATGQAKLRSDGTPCLHEFVGRKAGNCYHEYTCKHCAEVYYIDSGD